MTTTTEALRARLLAHAAIHDADLAHDAEQQQWAADLREAAAALSAIDALPATTGDSPEHLLQDQDRGLSRWLADKPDARLHAREAAAAIADQAQAAPVVAPSVEPVTLADVLDALNTFNRPKPSEDDGPWEAGHFIRVDYLPAFINIIAKAWFATPQAQPATPPAVQAPLPARFVQFTLRDLKAERKRLDGFLSLGNEIGRAAEYDEWIAALEAFAAAHGIGAAAQGGE